jgi:Transposase DDE domain
MAFPVGKANFGQEPKLRAVLVASRFEGLLCAMIRYRASKRDCDACPLKSKCCPNMPARQVPRDVNEEARDHARALMNTPEFEKSRDERKRVEMRFAHLKTHHRFERLRLRGLSSARDEFHLAAIVQNLKTMALRLLGPPPEHSSAWVA